MESSDEREAGEDAPEDYVVGRGRPPIHTRFKPGNKLGRGRPSGSPNAKTAFKAAFGKKKSVTIKGRTREIAMEQLANKSANGDLKAISTYLAYADKWPDEAEDRAVPQHQQKVNLDVIESLLELQRLAKEGLVQGNHDE
jgi:beta-xylosidase